MQKQTLFILPLIFLSAIIGIWAGWYRIGWTETALPVAGEHGAIMVGSFLGTLICLERAAALKKWYAFLVPLVSACSLIAFLTGFREIGLYLLVLGSVGFSCIMAYFLFKYSEFYFIILFAGAICWLVGNIMLIAWKMYPVAVSWWIAFLLLTITAERLELSRFLPFTALKRNLLYLSLAIFCLSLFIPFHGFGQFIMAVGLICVALWLLQYDMARKSAKKEGIHRYSGVLLLTGFVWLLVTGILMLAGNLYGFLYDAALHSFFIGFVFSMVFAHGPVILPAVLGISIKPYHPVLYLWFALLEGSLVVRIIADLLQELTIRKWAGMINGITILAFFISMAILLSFELRKAKTKASKKIAYK